MGLALGGGRGGSIEASIHVQCKVTILQYSCISLHIHVCPGLG